MKKQADLGGDSGQSNDDAKPVDGEVLDAPKAAPRTPTGDNYIALISQYTQRPDLLIDALELHDPGFVKRMNEKADQRSERTSNARFVFGGIQAYTSLGIAVIAALTILGLFAYTVLTGAVTFMLTIGMVVFFAVSQSGASGFMELCKAAGDYIRSLTKAK